MMKKQTLSVFVDESGGPDFKYASRCTVSEGPDVKVLARYADDGLPALATRLDGKSRSFYVCEPSGLTPTLLNRLARESGAYVAVTRPGLQLNMNGNFISVHCLRPGAYDFRLPFACTVTNLKSGKAERVKDGVMRLELTAGETCRFLLTAKESEVLGGAHRLERGADSVSRSSAGAS